MNGYVSMISKEVIWFMKLMKISTFAGIAKLNIDMINIIYCAWIIPKSSLKDVDKSRFKTKLLTTADFAN
jgi:hypothetical protein